MPPFLLSRVDVALSMASRQILHCAYAHTRKLSPNLLPRIFSVSTCIKQWLKTVRQCGRSKSSSHKVWQCQVGSLFGVHIGSTTILQLISYSMLHCAALACHLLLLTGRSPGKIIVSKSSGKVIQAELLSAYDARFQLDRGPETVPFRMTRNLQAFVGPHGMEGLVVVSMTAASQALQQREFPFEPSVSLMLRYAMSFQ